MSLDVQAIRKDFPALEQTVRGDKPLVYLDNAATTFKPRQVADAVSQYYLMETANIHRGVHYLSEQATEQYELARQKVQRFINADTVEEIIFTSGTTASINLVAQSLGQGYFKAGDEILITHMEHHSNIVPWQMLCEQIGCKLVVVPIDDNGDVILEKYHSLLTPKTKLVSMVYVSNSLGTINPAGQMIEAAHAQSTPVLLDAAQAVANLPVDVQELDCDFLAFSGHKLVGPTGIGVLYGKSNWLEDMPPVDGGGDMILSVTFEKTTYNKVPGRFEAGTPHIAGVIGLGAAIDFVSNIGLENIAVYEQELLEYANVRLSDIPGIRFIGQAKHKTSLISFLIEDVHPHDIGTILDTEGVAIRAGHHCTQPIMQRFGVPATGRASFSFYNTREEADILAEAIYKVKEVFV
jgi:cysteine desulfurase/selenocysteine lyase